MNVNSWLKKAKAEISPLDAELILKDVLHFADRSDLVLHADRELTGAELATADQMLADRESGKPLAYLLGHREFYGRNFYVTPDVLIPRPETEDCVDMFFRRTYRAHDYGKNEDCAIMLFRRHCAGHDRAIAAKPCNDRREDRGLRKKHNCTILDVGTGSGCLGITLALEIPEANVVGLDISEKALKVARKNARTLGAKNITFQQSDLLKNYSGPRPDAIVANLPYVDKDWDWTSDELTFEPSLALYADHHGLALIFCLLDEINEKWYNRNSYDYPLHIYLEADPCQHQEIITHAESLGYKCLKILRYILEIVR